MMQKFLAVLVILPSLCLKAEDKESILALREIPENETFISNNVKDIYQDNLGYIWYCKQDGLYKFDGYKYRNFVTYPSGGKGVMHPECNCIVGYNDGNIIIGSEHGINIFNYNTCKFTYVFPSKVTLSNYSDKIKFVKKFNKHSILIGTESGLFKMDKPLLGDVIEIPDFKNKRILNVYISPKGTGYVCSTNGVYELNSNGTVKKKLNIYSKNKKINIPITVFFVDKNKNAWIATKNQLYIIPQFESKKTNDAINAFAIGDFFSYVNIKSIPQVNEIYQDSRENIWITGLGIGLYKFDLQKKTYSHFTTANSSLRTNYTNCILELNTGQIIVGTEAGANILKVFGNHFSNQGDNWFNTNVSILNLHEIQEDKQGRLWLGTRGSGFGVVDHKLRKVWGWQSEKGDLVDTVRSILFDRNNGLWIGSGSGIYHFKEQEYKNIDPFSKAGLFKRPHALNGEYIYSMFEDRYGNVWIGSQNGLWFYNFKNKTYSKFKNNNQSYLFENEVVYFIQRDKEDRIWIGSLGENLIYFRDSNENYYEDLEFKEINQEKPNNYTCYFLSLLQSKDSTVWVGTNRGLHKINLHTNSLEQIKTKHIPVTYIFGIVEDKFNTLWLSSSKGIFRYNHIDGKVNHFKFQDGIPILEFNGGASLLNSYGNILFGSRKGLLKIVPENPDNEIEFNKSGIKFTNFKINGTEVDASSDSTIISKHISIAEKVKLKSNQRTIYLEFSNFDLYSTSRSNYICKLVGVDNEWVSLGTNNSVTYANLPSGKHKFIVKTSGNNSASKSIDIWVKNYWYLQWWFITVSSIILLVLIFYLQRVRIAQVRLGHKLQLAQFDREKSEEFYETKLRFFTNVSHEIRTPLSLIISPINNILKINNLNQDVASRLKVANRNCVRLMHIVDEILDFRKIDQQKIQLKVSYNDLKSNIIELVEDFKSYAGEKSVDLRLVVENEIDKFDLWYDKVMIDKVFINLISNAIKACSNGNNITISFLSAINEEWSENYESPLLEFNSVLNTEMLYVQVKDKGCGMTQEVLSRVFDRFYVGDNSSGTGIGLYLVKNFVLLHKGYLAVKSKPGIGTSVIIGLPLGKGHFKEEEFVRTSNLQHQYNTQGLIIGDDNGKEINNELEAIEKPTLLIVEDNDELRSFLEIELSNKYKVTSVNNAENAVNYIEDNLPEIIVSDVVMDEMSGFELCHKIKNDLQFSHIPFILLTAKVLEKDMVEGYNCGADSYVKKPFSIDVLQANIDSLLKNRQTLKEFFGQKGITIENIKVNDLDKELLIKVKDIIEKNIDSPELSMDDYASELGLSRTQFYRKMKALTGQTPNNYIKITRINTANNLLKESQLTVAEVAFKTGFVNPKYFTKCFKEQFGILPSEVR